MSQPVFGYKCQECGRGTVVPKVVPEYHTFVEGNPFTVKDAVIGICDVCGAEHFSLEETQRWERDFESQHESLYLKPEEIRGLRNKLRLSMEGLAHLMGCTRQSIYNWEREDRKTHQSRMADLMLRLLESSLEDGRVDILSSLVGWAKGFGHNLEVLGHASKPGIIELVARKPNPVRVGEPGAVRLAADSEEDTSDVTLVDSSGQVIAGLRYDYRSESLKLDLLRDVGPSSVDVSVSFHDGRTTSNKELIVADREVTLAEKVRPGIQNEVAKVVLSWVNS